MTTTQSRIRSHIANLGNANNEVAQRAERLLIRHYGARALGLLIDACKSPNPSVRFRAVWVLGYTRAPGAFEAIMELTNDLAGTVRYDAVMALGVLGDARAIPPLLALAAQDADEIQIPSAAFSALMRLNELALPALQTASQSDPDDRIRRAATEILAHIAEVAEIYHTIPYPRAL
ncbi:hypothetical protein CCAX7_18530 [Capsulimonas corticalis]|uniref:Uncharacterized protein n=1 Tax=Capsulimonas corticalis TaxID=2219043 RepID=A0A402D5J6_9BACT|nr:HEAT repeat domain-containing protein [Capsulimonas corticalis]BDI29802.1 hypothetical protein CCAX7_18530 [Capsulimonas corticalis]